MAEPKLTRELERWLLGELSAPEAEALRARLGDEALAKVRARHDEEQRSMLEARPPAEFARLVRARAREAPHRTHARRWWTLTPALAVACAIALVLIRDSASERTPSEGAFVALDDRTKGASPSLLVYRKHGSDVELLAPGSRAHAGDVLQIAYVAGRHRHGVMLSIDGAGAVTLHSPSSVGASTELARGEKRALDAAYQLDAAPGFERFVLVLGDAPIDTARVLDAARKLARSPSDAIAQPLLLEAHLEQVSFLVRKGEP